MQQARRFEAEEAVGTVRNRTDGTGDSGAAARIPKVDLVTGFPGVDASDVRTVKGRDAVAGRWQQCQSRRSESEGTVF